MIQEYELVDRLKYRIESSRFGKFYRNHKDELHREGGPAVEWPDGTQIWYLNGKVHREDGPAIERPSGMKEWWVNGELHREGGPAIEWADGNVSWYLNGVQHPGPRK